MAGIRDTFKQMVNPPPGPQEILRGRKSRALFALGEANWTSVDQLSANSYLAALMIYLGFSDGDIGTIMSLSALVCVTQLLTLSLNRLFRGKRMVVTITSLVRVWMAFLFFIPLMNIPGSWRAPLFVAVYFVARAAISFGGPAASEWIAQLTPMPIRGRYFSAKDATDVFIQAIVLLVAGMTLDRYKSAAPLTAFTILGVLILILCVLGFTAYMLTEDRKNAEHDRAEKPAPILRQMSACLSSRAFRIILTVDCLWQVTYYIAAPYNASYSIKEMSLSFTFISVVGFMGSLIRVFVSPRMGAWADRTSMARILRYAVFLLGMQYVVWTFMRPSAAVPMYLAMSLLSTVAWSFISAGLFGIKLELMPEEDRQMQLAVTAAISGVVGFVMSFISGRLLAYLQTVPMAVAGITIYPQQWLNAMGFICSLILCGYLRRVVEKEECARNLCA